MADDIRATPRSPLFGLFSDIVNVPLDYMSDPRRTQQMQGMASFIRGTGVPSTLQNLAYDPSGRGLFTGAGGLGGTTRMRPEAIEAAMTVAPMVGPIARMTKGLPVGMSIKDVSSKFNVATRDASEIFGPGAARVRYTEPNSGGAIEVLRKPDGSASVLSLEVPEKFRGQKIGESLQAQAMQDFPVLQGQVSSRAAAKTAYRLGRRPPGQPEASLDDVYKIMDEYSSVNLVSPTMQRQVFMPPQAPQDEALRLAQQRAEQLGQSSSPATRMLQQGFEPDWYHGSTGDIRSFDKGLLGESTGAESAKKGFFFARDPQNPPASMLKKSNDPAAEEMLRKLGIPEEEIARLNTVSMAGQGAETASGYAQIGGSRQYKEATRKAAAAEKKGNWDEYETQMGLAEDIAIGDQQYLQGITAKYGDSRDEMLSKIQNAIYSKQLPQKEAELLDAKVKQLMPYGWYNSYSNPQLDGLKKEIQNLTGSDASDVIKSIERFQSIKNERALAEKTQEGGNVMPVALRYKNPLVYDFQGSTYRDQTYADLIEQAIRENKDAVILKNTFDPGAGPSKLIDVGVVFEPDQIRSRFAAFDPLRKTAATAAAAGLVAPDLLANEVNYTPDPMYTDPFGYSIR